MLEVVKITVKQLNIKTLKFIGMKNKWYIYSVGT